MAQVAQVLPLCARYIQATMAQSWRSIAHLGPSLRQAVERTSMENQKLNMRLQLPPSINACYVNRKSAGQKGRALTEQAQNWKLVTGYGARMAARQQGWIEPGPEKKIVLEVVAYWPDRRRRDMNNLHKLLCDALEGVLYPDDKMVLVRDMDFAIDQKCPRLEICIYPKEEG